MSARKGRMGRLIDVNRFPAGERKLCCMDPHLLHYADMRAASYACYPPPSCFGPDVDARVHRGWLQALPEATALALHLRVPYCKQLCWHCSRQVWTARRDVLGGFVAALLAEIDLVASAAGAHGVVAVHWGGGTPNVLSAEQFLRGALPPVGESHHAVTPSSFSG